MAERYSHPADDGRPPVPLEDHLSDVAERIRLVVPPDTKTPFGSSVQSVGSVLGHVHDAGKLTTWFQEHIDGTRPSGPSHHSPLGALLAYNVLEETGHPSEECLAGFVAVAKHHGTLPNVAGYVFEQTAWIPGESIENRQRESIIEQVENIDKGAADLAETIVEDASKGETTWAAFSEAIRSKTMFDRVASQVSNRLRTNHRTSSIPDEFYQCVVQLWSALVLADKTSAARAPRAGFDHERPDRSTLSNFIDGLSDGSEDVPPKESDLNEYRRSAREDVLDGVDDLLEADDRLATLTLPTGMGKTLTGLDAALTILERTSRSRVVYALPFTSIIDQVVAEVGEIFETDGTDTLLTVHHHLAETVVQLEEEFDDLDEESDRGAHVSEMLGESWRSGLVVSTFVQLFESLAGPANTQSMKLPALYESVVILDEPQSLPHDWWKLVDRLVEILTTEYNAVVIAMTATQPKLFGDAVRELIDRPRRYFEAAERTEYVFDDSFDAFPDTETGPLGYDEATETFLDANNPGDDVLAICNTIDSAGALTDALRRQIDHVDASRVLDELLLDNRVEDVTGDLLADHVEAHADPVTIVHLSTRVRPCDRLILIDAIKKLTKRETSVYAISTQLIEAGVDVSFDRVFRDIAPIDSVVQAAGRCNRSFERDRGIVTLWWLDAPDEQHHTPGEAVYDRWGDSLLRLTKGVFDSLHADEADRLNEPRVAWDGVREYYRRLLEEKRVGKREYVGFLEKAEGQSLRELSLIENRLAVEVMICRTEAERDQIDEIREAWNRFDFETVSERLQELRSRQVSIPIYQADSNEAKVLGTLPCVHGDTDIRFLDTTANEYDDFFDPTTGFVVPDSTVERRFL